MAPFASRTMEELEEKVLDQKPIEVSVLPHCFHACTVVHHTVCALVTLASVLFYEPHHRANERSPGITVTTKCDECVVCA